MQCTHFQEQSLKKFLWWHITLHNYVLQLVNRAIDLSVYDYYYFASAFVVVIINAARVLLLLYR